MRSNRLKTSWTALVIGLASATAALAGQNDEAPHWLRLPSAQLLSRAYPLQARQLGIEGGAAFTCTVAADGSLQACTVVREDPAGYGFGQAALSLAPLFRMTKRDGGSPAGVKVTIPIQFRHLRPDQTRPASDGIDPTAATVGAAATMDAAVPNDWRTICLSHRDDLEQAGAMAEAAGWMVAPDNLVPPLKNAIGKPRVWLRSSADVPPLPGLL